MLEKQFSFTFRAAIFIIAFGAVIYAYVFIGEIFNKFKTLFFLTDSWIDLILIFVFAYCFFWILEWLLKLTYHILAGHRAHR